MGIGADAVVVTHLTTACEPYLTFGITPLPSNRYHWSIGDCLEGKRDKIIRSVLCNIVHNNCAQCNAHTYTYEWT